MLRNVMTLWMTMSLLDMMIFDVEGLKRSSVEEAQNRTFGEEAAAPSKKPKIGGSSDLSSGVLSVKEVGTTPYDDQKPGTSGVRNKTKTFMQENYVENFVQATFDALIAENKLELHTLLIGGDGRFYSDVATRKVMEVAFGNGVQEVWVAENGILSTPAVSAVIRAAKKAKESGDEKHAPFGCFILTASHNPGGLENDFGIKYNGPTGGPQDALYKQVFENSKKLAAYKRAEVFAGESALPEVNDMLAKPAGTEWALPEGRKVKVISSTAAHTALLKEIFDFEAIRKLIAHPKFSVLFDCMNGAQGPYAQRILVEELGVPAESVMRGTPLSDFGGPESPHHGHADPNLQHAGDIVAKMGLTSKGEKLDASASRSKYPLFGAAWDGDADRNMILGSQCFVIPSDSIAVLVDNANECIPYFSDAKAGPIKAAVRSMATSLALDEVCARKGITCFETPTGWKFFGNLMESGSGDFAATEKFTPLICGEEAFGTSSCHAREKDGMWAVLSWLQLLAVRNAGNMAADAELVGVNDVLMAHWKKYGRRFYARYDWEDVDSDKAKGFMANLVASLALLKGQSFQAGKEEFTIKKADEFEYTDPVDGNYVANQGVRIFFENGSRVVFRLSGTGVVGVTIRCYIEQYAGAESSEETLGANHLLAVADLADKVINLVNLPALTGRAETSLRT